MNRTLFRWISSISLLSTGQCWAGGAGPPKLLPLLAVTWREHPGWIAGVSLAVLLQTGLIAGLLVQLGRRRRSERSLRESEERCREIIESQTQMVCRYRADTTLTFANEAYCRFFGRSREQLVGTKFIDLIPTRAHDGVRKTVARLVESGQRTMNVHEVILTDGSVGWHQWEDYGIPGPDGAIEEYQGIGHDITEQRNAERALRLNQERMTLAAEAANLGFWVWDVDSGEVWMNDKRLEMMGFEGQSKLRVQDCLGRIHPEDRAGAEGALRGAVEGKQHFEAEYRIVLPGGDVRWLASRGRFFAGENGGAGQVVGVTTDITRQKRADEAMRTLVHSSRLALVGQLTASITHEMNQPLGAILSNAEAAEILLESGKPVLEEVRQILADIRRDDLRASQVIRHIRGLLSKKDMHLQPVNLHTLAADALRLAAGDASRRRVTIETRPMAGRAGILGDPVQLQQVLLNLIVNGMDAMSETAERDRRLLVSTQEVGEERIQVEVTDAGSGIPEDALERVFDSFFTTKENGMGLGLAIVRSIVEAHHGQIKARNNLGTRGATFSFTLPSANEQPDIRGHENGALLQEFRSPRSG